MPDALSPDDTALAPPTSDADIMRGVGELNRRSADIQSRSRAELDPMVSDIKGAMAERSAVPRPQLQPQPERPQTDVRGAMGEWIAAATVMGAIAGAMTRRRTTNALAAFTGTLEGLKEGDEAKFKRSAAQWAEAQKAVTASNKQMMDEYESILADKKTSIDEKMHLYQLAAIKYRDEMSAQAAATRNYTLLAQVYERQKEQANKLDESGKKMIENHQFQMQRLEYARETQLQVAKTRAGGDSGGTFDDAAISQRVQRRLAGEPMSAVTSGLGQGRIGFANRNKFEAALAAEMESQGLSASDLQKREIRYKGDTARGQTAGRFSARVDAATEEVAAMVPQAVEASRNLPRGKFVPINTLIQQWEKGTSNEAYNDFVTANYGLVNAYARAMNPTGNPRIAERMETRAIGLLSTATDQKAYEVQVNRLIKEVEASRGAIGAVREDKPIALEPIKPRTPKGAAPPPPERNGGAMMPVPSPEGWQTLGDPGQEIRYRKIE